MTPGVKSLLEMIRQHHAFQELLTTVEKPTVRPYRSKDADQVEHARAQWIYQSGQLDQHERWITTLTGKTEV